MCWLHSIWKPNYLIHCRCWRVSPCVGSNGKVECAILAETYTVSITIKSFSVSSAFPLSLETRSLRAGRRASTACIKKPQQPLRNDRTCSSKLTSALRLPPLDVNFTPDGRFCFATSGNVKLEWWSPWMALTAQTSLGSGRKFRLCNCNLVETTPNHF